MPKNRFATLDYELTLPSQHELIKPTEEYSQSKPVYIVLRNNNPILRFVADKEQVDIITTNSGTLKIWSSQILRGSENIN